MSRVCRRKQGVRRNTFRLFNSFISRRHEHFPGGSSHLLETLKFLSRFSWTALPRNTLISSLHLHITFKWSPNDQEGKVMQIFTIIYHTSMNIYISQLNITKESRLQICYISRYGNNMINECQKYKQCCWSLIICMKVEFFFFMSRKAKGGNQNGYYSQV